MRRITEVKAWGQSTGPKGSTVQKYKPLGTVMASFSLADGVNRSWLKPLTASRPLNSSAPVTRRMTSITLGMG